MKTMSAPKARKAFGCCRTARAEPVTIEKHGRAVAVMLSIEEFRRLTSLFGATPEALPTASPL